ncbi:MAG TPA: DUF2905 domain-containing protein [Vicinamibacteria bacterium]
MPEIGRVLLVLGLAIAALGLVLTLGGRVPWLGRLPGDLVLRRGSFTAYVPLATCLLLSAVLSLVLWWLRR